MQNLIICAGNGENFNFAKPVGVGLIDSAINLTLLIKENFPENIIFIATAGLYKKGKILEIYTSSSAANLEISSLLNLAYTPINSHINGIVSYETLSKFYPNFNNSNEKSLLKFSVNSSNFITTNEKMANLFFEKGYFLENMEFYSILKVANFFQIPAIGIFASTNFCDKNAHKDFVQNLEKAKKLLEKYIKNLGFI